MIHFNKERSFEMMSFFIIFLFLFVSFYFLFAQSTVINYQTEKKEYALALIALNQKKLLSTSDIQAQKELQTWKQQHPNFYSAIQSHPTPDQLLQLATNIAEKSGCSVIRAIPIISQKNNKQSSTNQIQLRLSGTYQNLFDFINQLNQTAWPYTLTELRIPQANQLNITLDMENQS